jgi:prepilin-type N-terminal cleavage/methylation domain-containing protein
MKSFFVSSRPHRNEQSGFTLLEVCIAILILVIGTAVVMQAVPTAIRSNLANRADSTSMVVAQRELNQMVDQVLTATQFTDADLTVCQLGSVATAGAVAGSPVITAAGVTRIDFNAAAVAGYSKNYVDPNGASGATYDVRWAVVVTANLGQVVAKRFVVGARGLNTNTQLPGTTVDAWVYR